MDIAQWPGQPRTKPQQQQQQQQRHANSQKGRRGGSRAAQVSEIASMAMRSALARLRQLESAVLRVEATLTKQTEVLGTLRKDQGADPRVVAREERR